MSLDPSAQSQRATGAGVGTTTTEPLATIKHLYDHHQAQPNDVSVDTQGHIRTRTPSLLPFTSPPFDQRHGLPVTRFDLYVRHALSSDPAFPVPCIFHVIPFEGVHHRALSNEASLNVVYICIWCRVHACDEGWVPTVISGAELAFSGRMTPHCTGSIGWRFSAGPCADHFGE